MQTIKQIWYALYNTNNLEKVIMLLALSGIITACVSKLGITVISLWVVILIQIFGMTILRLTVKIEQDRLQLETSKREELVSLLEEKKEKAECL